MPEKKRFGRRELLVLGAGAFVVASVPFAIGRGRRRLIRRTVPVMGTLAEVALVGRDGGEAHAAIDAAVDRLRSVDAAMTRFRATSDVGRANLAAPGERVDVSAETATVLEAALDWAQASDGIFDPCLGRAVELWDVPDRKAPPPVDAATRFARRRLYESLDLDGNAVVLRSADAAIDLGGIAKGHGVDLAVRALRERGVSAGLVNVGGDLYALGESEDGDPWKVGVRSASDPTRIERTLRVADAAVATSGDYERYFEHGGERYHHLLDPETGSPRRTGAHSVTVLAESCLTADAAATAAFGGVSADLLRRKGARKA